MHPFPGCIKPTKHQLDEVLKLLPDYPEEWKAEVTQSLLVSGAASIAYAGNLDLLPDTRRIDMTLMSGEEGTCFLSSVTDIDILLRFDLRVYRGGDGAILSDVDVFIYSLEDRPELEAAIFDQIASGYLGRLIADLGNYCPPDECARFIRSALEASPIGAAWKAEEAARKIKSSIEEAMPEKRASSVIRKARS